MAKEQFIVKPGLHSLGKASLSKLPQINAAAVTAKTRLTELQQEYYLISLAVPQLLKLPDPIAWFSEAAPGEPQLDVYQIVFDAPLFVGLMNSSGDVSNNHTLLLIPRSELGLQFMNYLPTLSAADKLGKDMTKLYRYYWRDLTFVDRNFNGDYFRGRDSSAATVYACEVSVNEGSFYFQHAEPPPLSSIILGPQNQVVYEPQLIWRVSFSPDNRTMPQLFTSLQQEKSDPYRVKEFEQNVESGKTAALGPDTLGN